MTPMENVIESTPCTVEWTRERVYLERLHSNPKRADLTLPPPGTLTACFTPEFLAELNRENKWVPIEPRREVPKEKSEAVGIGVEPCPVCEGRRTYWILHRGRVTGLTVYWPQRCDCDYYRLLWDRWKSVPPLFKEVSIKGLVSRSESQEQALAAITKNPNDSFLLIGPPGTGKTHFSFALYRRAVILNVRDKWGDPQTRNRVWRIAASTLLQQHIDWETRDRKEADCPIPAVMVADIQRVVTDGKRPSLFLDELDKIVPSEFKLNRLRELVDAVYEGKGQIVATMNKSPKDLMTKWGSDMGGTILRRIGGDGGHILKFE